MWSPRTGWLPRSSQAETGYQEHVMTTTPSARQHVGIIGRTLRLMLGIFLVWMTFTVMRGEDQAFNVRVLAVFGGLTAFYAIVHIVVSRYGTGLDRWFGAVLAVAPVIVVFALGGPLGRVASVAFVGVSLLVQVVRGDGGCEVVSIPSLLFGRPTHLVCILFSPIDLVEKHLTGPGGLPG
jgi:hypothetical protein